MSPRLTRSQRNELWAQVPFTSVSSWDEKTYINPCSKTLMRDKAFQTCLKTNSKTPCDAATEMLRAIFDALFL